jgi:uncharacterized protein (TIGR03437 family)
LTLDSAGNVWVAGNTKSADFPGLANMPPSGLDFALELNASATALQQIFALIPGTVTQPPVFDSNGNLLLLGSAGSLLRINPSTALSAPAPFAIINSAVPHMTAGVAPGELMTIYGTALGPSSAIVGEPDQNGLFPTQLGGVMVVFGSGPGLALPSVAAPLLYVGADQINLQVPFDITDPATVTITTPTGTLAPMQLPVIGSIGIFGVVNQDGSVNSASNPAAEGSIVSLYLTGLGVPAVGAPNGAVSQSARSAFQDTIQINWGYLYPLPILYAGTAPGLINGLDQLNVQLPSGFQNPALTAQRLGPVNGSPPATSNSVTVYTK